MKKTLLIILLLSGACIVKPPPDAGNLGKPATSSDVQAALDAAQSGVPQEKLFRVGDFGVVESIDSVLGNSGVSSIHELKVTEINSTSIIYTYKNVETGEIQIGKIDRVKPLAASTKSAVLQNFAVLFIKGAFKKIADFFKKIEIDQTRAVGEENRFVKTKGAATSQYFGLVVTKHKYVTQNCNQLADCKVNATRVEFNEVQTGTDYGALTLHWTYEISTEVPGLFVVLDRCFSTVLVSGDNQTPLNRCLEHVKTFQFGSN